jgi:hypothetical protein
VDQVDPEQRTAAGPRLNVSLGRDFGRYLGVTTGDKVYILANPDRPGTVVLMSAEKMREVVRKGWTAI